MTASSDLVAIMQEGDWSRSIVRGPNPTSFSQDLTPEIREAADRIIALEADKAALVEALKDTASRAHATLAKHGGTDS